MQKLQKRIKMSKMGEATFLSNTVVESVPEIYVCPPEMRPGVALKKPVPIVDFATPDRAFLIRKILDASQEFGFFQMINHGVAKSLLEETMRVFKEFHGMPAEDKVRECSKDPNKSCTNIGTDHFDEKFRFWRDYMYFTCYPLEKYFHFWPENPPKFRDVAKDYCNAMRKLTIEIMEVIIEGLGMGRECLEDEMAENTWVVVHHYPPCPNPSLTLGLKKHCDASLITILFQDVNGLQFLKDGQWIAVDPIDGALLVNIGHLLQVISNGKVKAGEHQVVTNAETARQSIVYSVYPKNDKTIEPAKCLISEADPPRYRSVKFGEFKREVFRLNYDTEALTQYLSFNYQP